MTGETQVGRVAWLGFTTGDADGRCRVIDDPSGAVAALHQPSPA